MAILWAAPAAAAPPGASDWARTEQAAVRLIAATVATGELDEVRLGLEFELAPGWKTYWRTPGDAGLPPVLAWTRSDNAAATDFRWPAPHRFTLFGLDTFGYGERVVFPIDVALATPGQPLDVAAHVTYLTCEEVCVPGEADLALTLPAGPADPSAFVGDIDRFRAQVPGDGSGAGLRFDGAVLTGDAAAPVLAAAFTAAEPFEAPDLLVEGPEDVNFERPQVRVSQDGLRAEVRVAAVDAAGLDGPVAVAGAPVRLTLIDGPRAMEAALAPQFGTPVPIDTAPMTTPLLTILGLALIGGLILNLMPCVLPVLSIKLLGVVGHGGGDRGRIRLSFLASAAGIVVSFLVLAAAAIAVKAGGMAVGWGIQFQQPLFLVAMVVLLTLFACNMWGLFEIRLPGWAGDAALRATEAERPHGLAGSFLTGAFATLLATPCTAPFLGTAVGFALSRGAVEISLVFLALGLGLALPYLLVALFPGIAARLPRPGPWMVVLRRVLSLALVATAVWLLSVLSVQSSTAAAAVIAGLMVVAAALLALGHRDAGWRRAAWPGVALAALLAFVTPALGPEPAARARVVDVAGVAWQPFDRAAISRLVAEGHVVFVDVTADWCLTCQVNKKLVLETSEFADLVADGAVVAMQADWTRPNAAITAYLASFGRYGIPFDAVYGPSAPGGVALPELLTRDAVFAALAGAGDVPRLAGN